MASVITTLKPERPVVARDLKDHLVREEKALRAYLPGHSAAAWHNALHHT